MTPTVESVEGFEDTVTTISGDFLGSDAIRVADGGYDKRLFNSALLVKMSALSLYSEVKEAAADWKANQASWSSLTPPSFLAVRLRYK
jgi:hypothetical protein